MYSLWLLYGVIAYLAYHVIFNMLFPRIPGPTPWPIIGNVVVAIKHRPTWHHWLQAAHSKYGKTYLLTVMGARNIITCEPENVEHILSKKKSFDNYIKGAFFRNIFEDLLGHGIFNADGDTWYTQRKTAAYEFSVGRFRDFMTTVFTEHGALLVDRLRKPMETQSYIDLQDTFARYTLDSIAKIAFGCELHCLTEESVPFALAFDTATQITQDRFINPLWKLQRLLGVGSEKTLRDALATIREFCDGVIKQRRQQDLRILEGECDLLSRFMLLKGDDGSALDDKALADIVVNFILAGRDTTANCLTWTFYLLSKHPAVNAAVQEEVDRVFGDDTPDYDRMKQCHYLTATVSEVLRLYPSVPADVKCAVNDDVLPAGNIPVRKGDHVVYNVFTMGRSKDIWGADSEEFKPSRWLVDGVYKKPSFYTYPVFQAGPRQCLGMDMAILEAKIAIAMLTRRYEIRTDPGYEATYIKTITLPVKDGLPVTVHPRKLHVN